MAGISVHQDRYRRGPGNQSVKDLTQGTPGKGALKNIRIMNAKYEHVVGILYNGESTRVFKNGEEYKEKGVKSSTTSPTTRPLFNVDHIDKQRIYELTARINNCLHFEFGIRNLYHRMIFTACALVAKRYDALMVSGMDYSEFHSAILNCLNKELLRDKHQNQKLSLLADVFSEIRMNLNVNSEDEKEQEHVKDLISNFIDWVTEDLRLSELRRMAGRGCHGHLLQRVQPVQRSPNPGRCSRPGTSPTSYTGSSK